MKSVTELATIIDRVKRDLVVLRWLGISVVGVQCATLISMAVAMLCPE